MEASAEYLHNLFSFTYSTIKAMPRPQLAPPCASGASGLHRLGSRGSRESKAGSTGQK